MQKWEYEWLSTELGEESVKTVNKMGEQGWEVINVIPSHAPTKYIYFFKRSKR
jgi:hypothetical protein